MNREASDRVRDFFAARSRDLTPASLRHRARVLYAPISDDAAQSSLCGSVLSGPERNRADRFVARPDREQFEQRRAFRRFCAAVALGSSGHSSKIVFEETESGRPSLRDQPKLWFSFSSCRLGALGAWSSTCALGVDIEDPTRELEATELAQRFFTAAEAETVEAARGAEESLQTFYRFWCLKEAALKSIGEGLPFGLDAFEFELEPGLRVVRAPADRGGPERFGAHAIEGVGGCAALVIRSLAG